MRAWGAIAAAGLAALAGLPADAQAPADPIDALLRAQPGPATQAAPPEPKAALPTAPMEARAPAPKLNAPVNVNETGKSPDGPPTAADLAYDNRIRAGMAAAEGFLGPLDGGWTLTGGGRELYVFQLSDRRGELQGAWRDPRRGGQADASGLIDEISRDGPDLRFRVGAASGVLHSGPDGRWTGEITEDGRTQAVRLVRRNP